MTKHGEAGSLRISGTGLPGGTTVELGGQDIGGALAGLSLRVGVDHSPIAVLDLNVHDLSAEVENPRIVMTERAQELLVRLGWTPPAEEASGE